MISSLLRIGGNETSVSSCAKTVLLNFMFILNTDSNRVYLYSCFIVVYVGTVFHIRGVSPRTVVPYSVVSLISFGSHTRPDDKKDQRGKPFEDFASI